LIDRTLVAEVRQGLAAAADAQHALRQQAYMKSGMPYHGVASAGVAAVCRRVFEAHPLGGFEGWRDTCLELWRGAGHREERYAAIALTGHRRYRAHQVPPALPMYEEMIVTGAWWDYVDEIAIHRVGTMLLTHRDTVRPLLLEWSTVPDIWRRRTSIIAQVMARKDLDPDLLAACIEPNLGDREFFIRKAIGWALRAYAWVEPEWVRAYVAANASQLSGLSRREALKNISGPALTLGP
jgi:3-methyladenine DNA glycosylase AlkD